MTKPRIICAVDRPAWAFHHIAEQIHKLTSDAFDVDIACYPQLAGMECDLLLSFWWNAHPLFFSHVKYKRFVVCLSDHMSWFAGPEDHERFRPAYERSDAVAVFNDQIGQQLTEDLGWKDRPVFTVEDGVDTSFFTPAPLPRIFTAGWCGDSSAGRGLIKNLDFVRQACERAKVPLLVADRALGQDMPHEFTREWYEQMSFYFCASNHEGTPNPPLEAMATGRPILSTPVGILPKVMENGVSGFFTHLDLSEAVGKIELLKAADLQKMGTAAREAAVRHDWKNKIGAWKTCLTEVLSSASAHS